MKSRTIRILNAAIAGVLAIAISWSAVTGNFFVPIIAMVIAIGLTYFLRKQVKEVTKDERTTLLSQKAAMTTIGICVPLMALVGIMLFLLREHLSSELAAAGNVLAYIACILLLVHSLLYSYYARKY